MSDGLPTEEQLRRIQRGVQHRIELRRRAARRVAGSVAGLALLGGGLALVVPFVGSGATSTSGAGSSAGSAAPSVVVRCHTGTARDSAATAVDAPAGASAGRLIAACDGVELQSRSGRVPSGGTAADQGGAGPAPSVRAAPSAAASPGTAVLCRAGDGQLHVFPAGGRPATLCVRNGMTPY